MMPSRKRSFDSKFLLVALVALSVVECGDKAHCDQLRDDTYAQRVAWAQCVTDDDCFPLAGNPRDCTGVISCPFAVNIRYREDAERLSLTIGEDSVDCHVCAVPNCNSSTTPHCEQTSHQCILMDLGGDAGITFGPPSNLPDAQPPPPPDDVPDAFPDGE